MTSNPITVNGDTFSSLRQAAAHFGKHYGNAARRVKAGWTPEEALELVPHQIKRPERGIKLTTSTGTFDSIRDAAEHFGIEEGTVHKRLSMGWTPDQAVGLESHIKKPKVTKDVTCAGKTYPNSWAMAQAYGKNEKLVAKRLRLGWTPEQAVEIEEAPPRFRRQNDGRSNQVWLNIEIVDGKEYPATDAGEYKLYLISNRVTNKQYVGITISPLWQRFNGHKNAAIKKKLNTKLYNAMRLHGVENFSIEAIRCDARSFAELQQQEIDEIIRRNTIVDGYNVSPGGSIGTPDRITVGGITFPSKGAAAEYFGIDAGVFNLRLGRLKWSPEQAAEIEPRPVPYRKKIVAANVEYPSIYQAAKAHGLSFKTVSARIKKNGWTVEQALGLVAPPETAKYQGITLQAFGQTFGSYADCARHYGIKAESLRHRVVKMGDDLEEAIRHFQKKPKGGAQSHPVTAFGKSFDSITRLAEEYGISVHSLRNRIRYQKQPLEDAIKYLQELKIKTSR
jgi:hypothetical protein